MLKLDNLTISQENTVLFSGLNCEFNSGQFWGIIGQNGIGKSTLLKTIAGLNHSTAGSLTVNNQAVNSMTPQQRAQTFSYLLQDQEPGLACSVREAVGMGRYPWPNQTATDDQITAQVMQTCRINHLADKSILKLSGGERRKVELATCLAQEADYLLLDEPLNHLDLVYRQHILQIFTELSQKKCVLMVCHDIEAVKQHCSHVLMLLANHCYLAGTSATILTQEHINQLFNDHRQHN